MHSDEQALDAKGLKHNFRHLFTVLWRVERWLGEDEPVFLGLTPEVRVNGLVPKLFDTFPVLDLSTLEQIANLMCLLLAFNHGFLAYVIVHLIIFKLSVFLNKKS